MKKIFQIILKDNNFITLLIVVSLWASIGTKLNLGFCDYSSEHCVSSAELLKSFSIGQHISNIRYLMPYFLFFYLFFKRIKTQDIKFFKNIMIFLFISFFIGYVNFYFFNDIFLQITEVNATVRGDGYVPHYTKDLFLCFSIIITSLLLLRFNAQNLANINIINYLFILLSTLITIYFAYQEYIFTNKYYLYYTNFLVNGELMGVPSIRSLGLARNFLFLSIPLTIYAFLVKKKIKFKLVSILLLIFILTNLYQLQSRTALYSFYFFTLSLIFYTLYKKLFLKTFQLIAVLVLIPQFLSLQVPIIKSYFLNIKIESKDNRIFNLNPNGLERLDQSNMMVNQLQRGGYDNLEKQRKQIQEKLIKDYEKEVFLDLDTINDSTEKDKLKEITKDDLVKNNFNKIIRSGLLPEKMIGDLIIKGVVDEEQILKLVEEGTIDAKTVVRSKELKKLKNLRATNKEHVNDGLSKVNQFSSGRLSLWDQTLNLLLVKDEYKLRLLGYGPASDRYLLSENVSSAFMYSLLSGGIMGGIALICFYLYALFILSKFLLSKKEFSNNVIEYSSFFIVLIILLRSLVENSFVVFGTDHIMVVSSLIYLSIKNMPQNTN